MPPQAAVVSAPPRPAPGAQDVDGNPACLEDEPEENEAGPQVALSQTRASVLPPLDELTQSEPRSPKEIETRIKELAKYFAGGTPQERTDAYKELMKLGGDLRERLPGLIETADDSALTSFASAAEDLKASGTIPAMITRLQSKSRETLGHAAMVKALASFDDPKAKSFVYELLAGSDAQNRMYAWQAIKGKLDQGHFDFVLKTAAEGGPESYLAANVLLAYGSNPQNATELTRRIEHIIGQRTGSGRLALIRVLNGMDTPGAATILAFLAASPEPSVRAAVMPGLARTELLVNTVINALRHDCDVSVKQACLRALADGLPIKSNLRPDLLELLGDPNLGRLAHEVLVKNNNGRDLGWSVDNWLVWGTQGNADQNADQQQEAP